MDCVLAGHLGEIRVDQRERPRVARLRLGCYAIFAGDPALPAAATMLRDSEAPIELIVPRDPAWTALLQRTLGERLQPRPMQAYSAADCDRQALARMATDLPEGFALRALDAELAAQLGPALRPNGMDVMSDPADFARRSGGIGVVDDGVLVCAATNYAFADDAIELAIATAADFRGRGLASCAAAAWTLHCLQQQRMPHWNASNPVSQRLALRLGYRPTEMVEVQFLTA